MKKIFIYAFAGLMLAGVTPSCKKDSTDKTGCTDTNADNFDSDANQNANCRYRYASNIDVSGVPDKKSDGNTWDDGNGPDIKVNFGKNSSSGFDYSTGTSDDYKSGSTATVHPASTVKFTNETWKFEVVDVDPLGSEQITTGTFNPLSSASNNTITITTGNGTVVSFKYTIQ